MKSTNQQHQFYTQPLKIPAVHRDNNTNTDISNNKNIEIPYHGASNSVTTTSIHRSIRAPIRIPAQQIGRKDAGRETIGKGSGDGGLSLFGGGARSFRPVNAMNNILGSQQQERPRLCSSFGDYGSSMLLQRHDQAVHKIFYRGYLMKRSNHPTEGYDELEDEDAKSEENDEELEAMFTSPLTDVISSTDNWRPLQQSNQQGLHDSMMSTNNGCSLSGSSETSSEHTPEIMESAVEGDLQTPELVAEGSSSPHNGLSQQSRLFAKCFFGLEDEQLNAETQVLPPPQAQAASTKKDSLWGSLPKRIFGGFTTDANTPSNELQIAAIKMPSLDESLVTHKVSVSSPLQKSTGSNPIPFATNNSDHDDTTSSRKQERLGFGEDRTRAPKNCMMSDCVDPRDGHVWRSKYCVLEEGVLFFYNNERDADLPEAIAERRRAAVGNGTARLSSSPATTPQNGFDMDLDIPPAQAYKAVNAITPARLEYLAKSPMPRTMHLMYNNSSRVKSPCGGSSTHGSFLSQSPSSNRSDQANNLILNNSQSGDDDFSVRDPFWEKRVSLEDVGAARTTEEEYGENSFVLMTSDQDSLLGGADCLVLRTSSTKQRDEWLFHFHSALSSAMTQFMRAFSQHANRNTGTFDDGDAPHLAESCHGRSSPLSSPIVPYPPARLNTRLGSTDKGSLLDTMLRSPLQGKHVSPSPNLVLSHGHGRSDVNRRRIREKESGGIKHKFRSGSVESSASMTQIANATAAAAEALHLSLDTLEKPRPAFVSPISANNSSTGPPSLPPSVPFLDTSTSTTLEPTSSCSRDEPSRLLVGIPTQSQTRKLPPAPVEPPRTSSSVKPVSTAPSPGGKWVPKWKRVAMENQKQQGHNGVDVAVPIKVTPLSPDLIGLPMIPMEEARETKPMRAGIKRGGCAHTDFGSIMDESNTNTKITKGDPGAFGGVGGGARKYSDKSNRDVLLAGVPKWEVGAFSEMGIRTSNEDAFLICEDLMVACRTQNDVDSSSDFQVLDKSEKIGVFAIFDGHVGNQAARYSSEFLVPRLNEYLQKHNLEQEGSKVHDVGTLTNSLLDAIEKIDTEFCHLSRSDAKRNWEGGSTALVSIISGSNLLVANVGDCRGILCATGRPELSHFASDAEWNVLEADHHPLDKGEKREDVHDQNLSCCFWKEICEVHSPSRADERARIEAANGWVTEEKEVCIAQLKRVDLDDEDVVQILKKYFADRIELDESDDTSSDDDESSLFQAATYKKEGKDKKRNAAPGRLMEITRTCGELAVSRAIGDRDFKASFNTPTSLPCTTPNEGWWEGPNFLVYDLDHSQTFNGDLVTADPEIQAHAFGADGVTDEFIVFACDGLWDVMDSDDVVGITRTLLFGKKWPAKRAVSFRRRYTASHILYCSCLNHVCLCTLGLISTGRPSD
jgi:serine/threonine protein phosphatase PrpC